MSPAGMHESFPANAARWSAQRSTHVKSVAVALVFAIAIVVIGINAKTITNPAGAPVQTSDRN